MGDSALRRSASRRVARPGLGARGSGGGDDPRGAELRPEGRVRRAEESSLVFGRSADSPFSPSTVNVRAAAAWNEAELEPIGLHECRHTCASYFIAAGINAKTLSTFLGHASITTTLDRYGHLFPGSEAEAAGLLDAYLVRASTDARMRQRSA